MIWLVGAGWMSEQYVKVLQGLNMPFQVIGRGPASAEKIRSLNAKVIEGGIEAFLNGKPEFPSHAIVSVGADDLYACTRDLLKFGVKKILVEKPAGLALEEIRSLSELSREKGADVVIGYNRRFYQSVLEAEKLIEADGGILSAVFEFTEWAHDIENAGKSEKVLKNWFLANSTHVVDLALYFLRDFQELHTQVGGRNLVAWHPDGAIFMGSGHSSQSVPFSYSANWSSAGRWSLELHTLKRKLIFRPMEELQTQDKGTVQVKPFTLTSTLDKDYKAGLFLQVQAFLKGDLKRFPSIHEQLRNFGYFYKILGRNTAS